MEGNEDAGKWVYVVARREEAEQGAGSTRPRREPQGAIMLFCKIASLVIGHFRGELVVLFYFPCGNDERQRQIW
jgi:hypothetical protein